MRSNKFFLKFPNPITIISVRNLARRDQLTVPTLDNLDVEDSLTLTGRSQAQSPMKSKYPLVFLQKVFKLYTLGIT